jgi:uncharacterized protein
MRDRWQRPLSAALSLAGVVLCGMVVCAAAAGQYASPSRSSGAEVILADKTRVAVEIADSEDERALGLMHRKFMSANDGMIFVFDEPGRHAFWMKNTLIPLDMLWLDPAGKVVWIAKSVPPCRSDPCPTYPPAADASYVLEVNAGFADKHGVKVGDALTLRGVPAARKRPAS